MTSPCTTKVLIGALFICVLITGLSTARAQQLPPILETGSSDPSAFDIQAIKDLVAEYKDNNVAAPTDIQKEKAKLARNRLIGIGREQVDAMFYGYIKKDRKKRAIIQFVLDFLEIGAASAIAITNGERAKNIISEGLGALQATRTSLNKNFQLLERQILINKMAADRATILTDIFSKRDLDAGQYSWEDARADLRAYRNAGTIDGALINLSSDVGRQKEAAEDKLRDVKDKPITRAATPEDLDAAEKAFAIEDKLETDLGDAAKKAAALATLKKIVAKLAEDKEIGKVMQDKGLTTATIDGMEIINTLDDIKSNANVFNKRDLTRRINLVIIDVGSQR